MCSICLKMEILKFELFKIGNSFENVDRNETYDDILLFVCFIV